MVILGTTKIAKIGVTLFLTQDSDTDNPIPINYPDFNSINAGTVLIWNATEPPYVEAFQIAFTDIKGSDGTVLSDQTKKGVLEFLANETAK